MVNHNMLLPHETFAALYDHGLFEKLLCPSGAPWIAIKSQLEPLTPQRCRSPNIGESKWGRNGIEIIQSSMLLICKL